MMTITDLRGCPRCGGATVTVPELEGPELACFPCGWRKPSGYSLTLDSEREAGSYIRISELAVALPDLR